MELYNVGGFCEVFDSINKITVYVSESESSAVEALQWIESGHDIPMHLLPKEKITAAGNVSLTPVC